MPSFAAKPASVPVVVRGKAAGPPNCVVASVSVAAPTVTTPLRGLSAPRQFTPTRGVTV